ncbi:MAG: hypothetical protein F4Y12_03445 [Acidimicrobiaceae bacterium]|nr:hypothetical protein [Acidimicrobiaceae bacterium]MYH78185.1 hypothetical protein [Acidimicrobiaceae bacterium]
MPEDDSTVEERLAIRLIREFEDLVHVERLEPPGSVPTPDWRIEMVDGRIADVEVVWDANEAGRRFESQLAEEHPDDDALVRWRSRKEWPDPRLSLVWDVEIYDYAPESNRCPAKELVEALIEVLVDVEARGGTPQEMVEAVGERLVDPRKHFDSHNWIAAWQRESARGIGYKEFLLRWGQQTGYWCPRLLVDEGEAPPRHILVWRASEPEGSAGGMVRTFPSVTDVAWGEYEHMLATVQGRINAKTDKRQMENAPSFRWLFVVLEPNLAAAQLDDYFGPAWLKPDAPKPSPYHVLDTLTFDYFDELWITGRAFHERAEIVLRLFKTGDAPQHKIVRRPEVLTS